MRRANFAMVLLAISVDCSAAVCSLVAETITVTTDTTWRATNPKPPAGWNTDVAFDDSDTASWQYSVKDSKPNNHIWFENIMSDQAPANAWFRKVFTVNSPVLSASTTIWLDDNGQVYINGTKIVDDNGSGGSSYDLSLDPSLFRVGQNLIAIHGVDQYTPYHTVGMELSLTIPEPGSGFLSASIAAGVALLCLRTSRRTQRKTLAVHS